MSSNKVCLTMKMLCHSNLIMFNVLCFICDVVLNLYLKIEQIEDTGHFRKLYHCKCYSKNVKSKTELVSLVNKKAVI